MSPIAEAAEAVFAQIATPRLPRRIACLTEETVEVLYRLGEGDRVVGVSAYARRPPEARAKPKVSAFVDANFDRLMKLEPDLVLCFSDLQADIAAECARRGLEVVVFNQRSIAEILGMVLALGAIVGKAEAARDLVEELSAGLREAARQVTWGRRPRVYFEEWDEPLIAGIRWVSELIAIAGGEDIFAELRQQQGASGRIVRPAAVVERDPELILASWCGKKVRRERILGRPGWEGVAAVRTGHVHEIASTLILQPGPAALTDGLAAVQRRVGAAARSTKNVTAD